MDNPVITPRDLYADQLFRLLDGDNILIMTGARRVGKSCIAMQIEDSLYKRFPDGANVIRISFEKNAQAISTADELIDRIKEQYALDKRNYCLLDEVMRVDEWEQAVNYLCSLDHCKVILISSNRRILSPKLQAIREEKHDEIHILPLSLGEFIQFQRFQETTNASVPFSEKRYKRFSNKTYTIREIYKHYITYGGFPVLMPEYAEKDRAWIVTDGLYGAIVTRDILEVESSDEFVAVTDLALLRCVVSVMIESIGDNTSATWISKQTSRRLGRPTATKTIQSYVQALLNAHMFYIAERLDIRSGRTLKTMAKYYVVDACFYNYFLDVHADRESPLLEHKVFFELLRRGCKVYNGVLGQEQITFVAIKGDERCYIQVTDDPSKDCLRRLYSSLRKIRDDSTRMVIALGAANRVTYEGIIEMDALEFLMGYEFMW